MNTPTVTELPAWNNLSFQMTDALRSMLKENGQAHEYCRAYDLEFYRQAYRGGAFYVMAGREATKRPGKCDLCRDELSNGARKFYMNFGRETGYRHFCPDCMKQIEAPAPKPDPCAECEPRDGNDCIDCPFCGERKPDPAVYADLLERIGEWVDEQTGREAAGFGKTGPF